MCFTANLLLMLLECTASAAGAKKNARQIDLTTQDQGVAKPVSAESVLASFQQRNLQELDLVPGQNIIKCSL